VATNTMCLTNRDITVEGLKEHEVSNNNDGCRWGRFMKVDGVRKGLGAVLGHVS